MQHGDVALARRQSIEQVRRRVCRPVINEDDFESRSGVMQRNQTMDEAGDYRLLVVAGDQDRHVRQVVDR